MEEKSCFVIKGGFPQIRRKYNNVNVFFLIKERSRAFKNSRYILIIYKYVKF